MNLKYDYKQKASNVQTLNRYMLAKTISMFEWENLPDSIPYKELEKMLQTDGYAFVTEVEGVLYCFTGGLGGELDVYGNPTTITIANPALRFNKTLNILEDGVMIYNDDMGMGLIPLYNKHHTMMVENDINMTMWGYNSRSQRIISASDDRTKDSAQAYLDKIVNGELGVIGENAILEGVKIHGASSSQGVTISSMIEFQQYQKANLYNEVGLSANFNMKRERLITSEVEAGEDSLFPFVFNMMKCRLKAIEKLNSKYDLEINIDFGSVWHFKSKELVDDVVDPDKLNDLSTIDQDLTNDDDHNIETVVNDVLDGERSHAPTPDTVTDPVDVVDDEPKVDLENGTDKQEVLDVIEKVVEEIEDAL